MIPHSIARLHYKRSIARQAALETLFIKPARQQPQARFMLGGAQYPTSFLWTPNIFFVRHLPPAEHPAFFCSSRLTLHVTRQGMAEVGYCPSGRLFEAAAGGAPVVSDWWEGLEQFFLPQDEIIIARTSENVLETLALPDATLASLARAARERALSEHTAARGACELESLLAAAL